MKTTAEFAKNYLKDGFQPIPLKPKTKQPQNKNWQELRTTPEEVAEMFPPDGNVGLLTGTPSGGLVDVDLDAPEAIAAAQILLPETGMIHGRPGKGGSHRWYRVEGDAPTVKFSGPDRMLLELRGERGHTMVPPSIHPTGEPLLWEEKGAPEWADYVELRTACAKTAAAALLAQHWKKNHRQEIALALSGALLRAGWAEHQVAEFLGAVLAAANDEEPEKRFETIESTLRNLDGKGLATGRPRLRALLGDKVVDRVITWLGVGEARKPEQFQLLSLSELDQIPDLEWLIEGVIPANGLCILYGTPGLGKTFLALDWGLRVACGFSWAGRQIRRGKVVYTASEGLPGLKARVRAWEKHHERSPEGFFFLRNVLQLGNVEHLDALIDAVRRFCGGKVDLVIIDTLARSAVGKDESGAKDMGVLIDGADRIRRETGAAVLLVHHPTKERNSLRGSTTLVGAPDTIMCLKRPSKRKLVLECEKQRDAALFDSMALSLDPVGESCLMSVKGVEPDHEGLSEGEYQLLAVLSEKPEGVRGVDKEVHGFAKSTFHRHARELRKKGLVESFDGLWKITSGGLGLIEGESLTSPTTLKGGTMRPPKTTPTPEGE